MDAITEKSAKPHRRRLQFSLRTLLVVVTVLTVPVGWVGWKRGQVRKQRPTITWVEEMGGNVSFRSRIGTDERSWWEELTDKWFGGTVRFVSLEDTQVSDLSPLSPLADLKSLRFIDLQNTQVSNLSPLAELKSLEVLWLQSTRVSDEQVQKLRQALPNCKISHSIRVEK